MELSHLNQSLYQRAISASVEGQSRQDGQKGLTPESPTNVKKDTTAPVQRHKAQQQRIDDIQRRVQNEQLEQRSGSGHEREAGGYTEAASVGDQLAMASRQARQTRVRRNYAPPALVSATGQEANRVYLDVHAAAQPRFIDEIV